MSELILSIAKEILFFMAKALGISATFWLSWIFIFRPISLFYQTGSAESAKQEVAQAAIYSRQLKKAEDQLAKAEGQQKRMDSLLSHYEEQAVRYDAVLTKWEREGHVRETTRTTAPK